MSAGQASRLAQSARRLMTGNSLGARFARGAFWSVAGAAISHGLAMVASIVTARLLGKVGFGEYGMINSTIGTFGTFAGLGLGLTSTKFVAEYRKEDPERAGRILGLTNHVAIVSGGLVALLVLVLAPYLAAHTINAPHLILELRMGCALLFFNALSGAQNGSLSGLEAFRRIAWISCVRGFCAFPIMILGVWLFKLQGAVMASVLTAVIGCVLGYVVLRQEAAKAGLRIANRGFRQELPVLWRFSLPAVLSGLAVGPVLWLANTILVGRPEGYGELGLLNASNQWRMVLMFLPGVLLQVALPMLSSTQGKEESEQDNQRIFEFTQGLTMLIVVPLATLLMYLSEYVMRLYGAEFHGGAVTLIGVAAAIMIQGIGAAGAPAIQSRGRMWFALLVNVSWGLVFLTLVWFGVERYGASAVSFGSAAAYFCVALWTYLALSPILPKGMLRRMFLMQAVAIALTAGCLALPAWLRAPLAAPVTLATMIVLFWLTDANLRRQIVSRLPLPGKRQSQ